MVDAKETGGLYGMKDICAHMRKSESTVLRLIRECGFPAAKVGGEWMSDVEAVATWRKARLTAALGSLSTANKPQKPVKTRK